jgi:hypothetical protein
MENEADVSIASRDYWFKIAHDALSGNGFRRCAEDEKAASFISVGKPPYRHKPHPNGPDSIE